MKVNIYRNYRFVDKDPIIDALRTVVKSEQHLTNGAASAISGVAPTTFHGWFDGATRRPNNATSTQVAAALGYVRRDELTRDGQVVVGYVRVRDLDLKKEREKMADWILKQRGPKKKRARRKKANGGG
jgi:hypothetical protein